MPRSFATARSCDGVGRLTAMALFLRSGGRWWAPSVLGTLRFDTPSAAVSTGVAARIGRRCASRRAICYDEGWSHAARRTARKDDRHYDREPPGIRRPEPLHR